MMVFSHFSKEDQLPRFKSQKILKDQEHYKMPYKSVFWAAGFSFSMGQLIYDCPYISDLEHVFFGEEHLQMFFMWKKGYTLLTPP